MAVDDKGQRSNWSNEESASEKGCDISSCHLIITSGKCITFMPAEGLGMVTRKQMSPVKTFARLTVKFR